MPLWTAYRRFRPPNATNTRFTRFAKERRFTGRQASAFLSIACELVFEDQQSPFRRSADSFARFKELLFRHTVQSPPERSVSSPLHSSRFSHC